MSCSNKNPACQQQQAGCFLPKRDLQQPISKEKNRNDSGEIYHTFELTLTSRTTELLSFYRINQNVLIVIASTIRVPSGAFSTA